MAEESVNDLKNRLAIVEWRPPLPASGHGLLADTRIGLAPAGEIRACTWATSSPSPPNLSTAVAAIVRNVLERLVRAAALTGLMTGLA
jgi:hypothetical protein